MSESIILYRGTRQGCPLSRILYNLATEPLSRHITKTDRLYGIQVNDQTLKSPCSRTTSYSSYHNPNLDLTHLKNILDEYGSYSGLKINCAKSKILSLLQRKNRTWKTNPPLKITTTSIKYLGINIGQTSQSIYNLNYRPLINKIIKELGSWKNFPISIFGRVHLFKMTSFAKLLYPMQTLPLQIHTTDIRKINKALTDFLWQGKRPKIALQKLWLPKPEGGLNVPNIKLYNQACLLRHAID